MRILFVESDNELRAFYGSKLRDEFTGTIDLVATGKEAIKLLRSERPYDVIISEIYTFKGTGLDLYRFKIRNKIRSKIILLSLGMANKITLGNGLSVISKVDLGTLFKEVSEHIRQNKFDS